MSTDTNESVLLDLNDLTGSAPVQLATFAEKVKALDVEPYRDREVRIKGCAPTWAHLMVAGRLFPVVRKLEFLLDDGKDGHPLPVFEK